MVVSREQLQIEHQKVMRKIRDEVAHTCDGPLTPFVHVARVLEMVHANTITAEQGANYLSESNLLSDENETIESSEFHSVATTVDKITREREEYFDLLESRRS